MAAEESSNSRLWLTFPLDFSVEQNYRAGIQSYFDRIFNTEGEKNKVGLLGTLLDENLVYDAGMELNEWSFMTFVTFNAVLVDPKDWMKVCNELFKYT